MVFFNDGELDFIRYLAIRGITHSEIAQYFQTLYTLTRGYSERSIRRVCRENLISRITDYELDLVVENFISRYGHTYGRSMMQGSINAAFSVPQGVVSQRRISRALQRVAPEAFEARTRDTLERTNPIPYYAPYFGYKVHMDQNEKLAQNYGCTHVAMIDGCSRMICGFASMEIKNPILIYEFEYRPALVHNGLWDQLRVDHGTEFFLCIFVQELLKEHRNNKHRAPWRQTTSTENYVIERFWPELNSRVNYPVKRALNRITEVYDYDLTDPIIKFCFSLVLCF